MKKLRLFLIAISAIATLLAGVKMVQLDQAKELWGHWPLLLFLGAWLLWVSLWSFKWKDDPRKWRLFGLAVLTGVLLSLPFPPLPFVPFVFVAFIPLLYAENLIGQDREGPSKWQIFKTSYHSFLLWNILTTFWVANTSLFAGIFANTVNALFMSLPFILYHQSRKVLDPKFRWLAFLSFWLAFEYLHLRHELSWPWLTLGNTFAHVPWSVQWYEYTGILGGSFWILLANVLGYQWVERKKVRKEQLATLRPLLSWALFLVLPLGLSLVLYFNYEEKGEAIEVLVIQPNFEPHYEKQRNISKRTLARTLPMADSLLTEQTDFMLLPETSFHGLYVDKIAQSPQVKALQKIADRFEQLSVVSGFGARRIFDAPLDRPALRTYVRPNTSDTIYWESYNAAVQISAQAESYPIYYKSKLVPGAEFTPYRNVFFFLEPFVKSLGGSLSGLGMQEERSVFSSGTHQVAPVICYESIYGAYSTGYVLQGAQALFILTNDGWWDRTAGHRQHLAFASLRAIETRRSIARSANTGISAFINQRGDIVQATNYGETTAIKGTMRTNDTLTFYTRWRDMLGRIALFMAILLVLNTFVKARLKVEE